MLLVSEAAALVIPDGCNDDDSVSTFDCHWHAVRRRVFTALLIRSYSIQPHTHGSRPNCTLVPPTRLRSADIPTDSRRLSGLNSPRSEPLPHGAAQGVSSLFLLPPCARHSTLAQGNAGGAPRTLSSPSVPLFSVGCVLRWRHAAMGDEVRVIFIYPAVV
jgi:hypothetical protein